jgi:uncharacterized protein YdeI (YjbR/CyaY-like superfamily)
VGAATAAVPYGEPVVTTVEDFFAKGCGRCERFATPDCSTRTWLTGLTTLRRICRDVGLEEVAKWGQPCYLHAGRNVAIFGAFRGDYRLSFFHGGLMRDPEGILEPAGPNARHASVIRFRTNEAAAELEPVLRAYLREAMVYAEAGRTPPREERALDLPDEVVEALDADPELAEAFAALTPGRQRSWAIHVGSAKRAETRVARIARAREPILAGKGANER